LGNPLDFKWDFPAEYVFDCGFACTETLQID